MRILTYILFIFCVLVLFTCKSAKNKRNKEYSRNMKMAKPLDYDTLSQDSDSDGVVDFQDREINEAKSASPIPVKKQYKSKKTATIVDNSEVTSTVANTKKFIKGLIAYSVPDEMKVGELYDIKIRISKDTTEKKTLIVGDTKIPINDTTVNSTITIESIRVSSIMSASLRSDSEDNFEISSKSTEVQNIEAFGYTEWEWNVKPLKSGNNPLKLIIKVRITSDDGEKSFKDIVVFDKNILIKTNIKYTILEIIKNYWEWSFTTLILPFIIWLYNRRKKNNESKGDS